MERHIYQAMCKFILDVHPKKMNIKDELAFALTMFPNSESLVLGCLKRKMISMHNSRTETLHLFYFD